MAFHLTDIFTAGELAALEEKAISPEKTIPCPRCGCELTYFAIGYFREVKCSTEHCLKEQWHSRNWQDERRE